MKCLCGYVEPVTTVEEITVLFKSGPRKGQLKEIKEVITEPRLNDLFIRIGAGLGFGFTRKTNSYYGDDYQQEVALYACPVCSTVQMFGG
jgi:hypothetical protein